MSGVRVGIVAVLVTCVAALAACEDTDGGLLTEVKHVTVDGRQVACVATPNGLSCDWGEP